MLEPRPAASDLQALHTASDYFEHPYFSTRRSLSAPIRAACEAKLARIEAAVGTLRGKTMIDVGCDTGLLVAYASESRAMTAIGIDIFPRVVELGRAAGRDLRVGTLESLALPAASADLLCAYDVLEHVTAPAGFVVEAKRVLRPGGVLALETPNYSGFIYCCGRLLARSGRHFAALQERLWPPFHVQYFTAASLAALLRAAGYAEVEVTARDLDGTELALTQSLVRAGVRAALTIGRALGAPALLTALAMTPATPPR